MLTTKYIDDKLEFLELDGTKIVEFLDGIINSGVKTIIDRTDSFHGESLEEYKELAESCKRRGTFKEQDSVRSENVVHIKKRQRVNKHRGSSVSVSKALSGSRKYFNALEQQERIAKTKVILLNASFYGGIDSKDVKEEFAKAMEILGGLKLTSEDKILYASYATSCGKGTLKIVDFTNVMKRSQNLFMNNVSTVCLYRRTGFAMAEESKYLAEETRRKGGDGYGSPHALQGQTRVLKKFKEVYDVDECILINVSKGDTKIVNKGGDDY